MMAGQGQDASPLDDKHPLLCKAGKLSGQAQRSSQLRGIVVILNKPVTDEFQVLRRQP